ncbi:MAG: hypothetical protein JXA64_11250 [Candidatus Fermentibacteraceae bacterium]|nr:hypothetical protein [Candidatus Fermentibacteraceae bacterium]MBN2609681.1 hypothetical protein [Candidatus Fermentibacteraceae bacterium]
MTAAVLAVGVLIGSVQQTGLPLRDPLNWWLYMMETGTEVMLPGTLPLVGSPFLQQSMPYSGFPGSPAGLIIDRSAPPGWERGGETRLSAEGTVACEILNLDGETETRAGGTGRIYASILPGLFIDERLSLWTGSDELPPDYFSPFHQGSEKGRHLYVDWGYLRWSGGPVAVSFGRIPQRWGPGRFTQLLLSDNGPPLDMLRIELRILEDLEFTGLTATVDSDSGTYLTAHRLDITPTANLRIGLSESILFKAGSLDFAYMNPVIPWYPVQWNERDDDNAFICLDASWKPVPGLETYGEFLIDDIQYENDGNRPDKLGWTTGLSGFLKPLGLGAVIEYTRIDRYVYSQRRPCNFYLHRGEIIGSGLGPDADRATLSLGTAAAWPVLAEVTLEHTRHGEGTVQEGWPDSVAAGGKFPSGIVEHTSGVQIHLGWYPSDFLEVHGMAGNEWVRNRGHVTGESDNRFDTSLEIIYRW